MKRTGLPRSAFTAPHGANREAVTRLLGEALARILAHSSSAESRPPLSLNERNWPSCKLPERGIEDEALLDELAELLSGCMNQAHPGYLGHMDPMPSNASLIGALAAAAVNNNMLSVEMSPVFSRLEWGLLKSLAARFGLGDDAGGVMASGGTLANLQALALARNRAFDVQDMGLTRLGVEPVVFASEAAHVSIRKAAMLLGLGRRAVVSVACDPDSRMRVAELRASIERAGAGQRPFCVVATAGTTTTGNIDDLRKIGEVCAAHGLWFHVDAAYGGALVFSERHRHCLEGIERADSITFNPQKWLYVARACAMLLLRDVGQLESLFRVSAPYMGTAAGIPNLGEIGVQGTRASDVLKLWLSLRHLGVHGYATLIDASCELARHFKDCVDRRPYLVAAGRVDTNVVCFRGEPGGLDSIGCDRWNTRLQQSLLRDSSFFLSLPTYRDGRWLRAVLLNPYTDEPEIDRLFERIDAFAARYD